MELFAGKRLVVLGCGYVGAAVARAARARGAEVVGLTRNEAKAIALRDEGIEMVVADLADDAWHGRIAGEADFVLNAVSSGGGGVEGYRASYVGGMQSIVRWAAERGAAGTVVYTSSTSVYPQSGGAMVDESSATGGDERARLLLEAESILRGAGERACRRWFVLRLAGIYGPGRHYLLNQVKLGEVAGRGEHRLNLVHRDDIAAAVLACFAARAEVRNEIVNLADDGPTPKQEVVAWLARRVGVAEPRFTGEPAGGRRTVTPDRVIVNAKAKALLRWQPKFPSFRDGYADVLSC